MTASFSAGISPLAAVQMATLRLAVQRKMQEQIQNHEFEQAKADEPQDALEWSRRYGLFRTADNRILQFKNSERDYQTRLLLDRSKRIIVGKARQIGVSNTLAFRCAYEALRGGTVLVVSKSLEQAVLFLRYVYIALNNAPHPRYLRRSLTSLEFVTGGGIFAQASSDKAGRGIPATLAILDEYAWQEYAKDTYTAILPSLSTTDGTIILLSTPNGQGEPFQEAWEYAQTEEGAKIWSSHFLPWSVNPNWDDDWADRMREDMGEREFAQEYAVDFLLSGLNVFNSGEIESLWKLPNSGDSFFETPIAGHRYVSAFDIARKRDAFVGFTFDITSSPYRVVAYERALKMDYPDMAQRINDRHWYYNGFMPDPDDQRFTVRDPQFGQLEAMWPKAKTAVESNGVGDPLIQFLSVPVTEFNTSPLSKKNAIDALLLLMQRGELVSPLIAQWKKELTIYVRQDEKITQDTVMASAIAALIAGRPIVRRVETVPSLSFYSG
jgi:hypothetical protein